MAFIYDALVVGNITALKALDEDSTPKRVDGLFLAVGDRGDGYPGWFRYDASSVLAESLPNIISPTDTIGRWLQFFGKVAALNVAQQFSGNQSVATISGNISGSVIVDGSTANKFDYTITGNVTNFTVTNLRSGTYIFNLIENSTGGYTLVFDTAIFKFPDGGTSSITTTANKRNKVVCDCNGTRLDCSIGVWS